MATAGRTTNWFAIWVTAAVIAVVAIVTTIVVVGNTQATSPGTPPDSQIVDADTGAISFGSGQLFGIGIFSPDHRYVPDMYNDMIFTFIGESVGFLGALAVLLVYGLLLGRILRIGLRCSSRMGRLVCAGVFAMLAAQIMINVAMCLMVGPSVGVTLPLLSAGGSSVLSAYLGLGLVLSVRHGEKTTKFS